MGDVFSRHRGRLQKAGDCMAPLTLRHDARSLAAEYREAVPFPHIALDGLFDDETLGAVLREIPSREAMRWRECDSTTENKLGSVHETSSMSKTVRVSRDAMNSFEMLLCLQA